MLLISNRLSRFLLLSFVLFASDLVPMCSGCLISSFVPFGSPNSFATQCGSFVGRFAGRWVSGWRSISEFGYRGALSMSLIFTSSVGWESGVAAICGNVVGRVVDFMELDGVVVCVSCQTPPSQGSLVVVGRQGIPACVLDSVGECFCVRLSSSYTGPSSVLGGEAVRLSIR
jgi:hypothetical protein